MKDRYEISLWEDYLVEASNGVPAHFEERKLCVIGSNSMTDSFRAFSPEMVSNINGTHKFTFKMYYVIKENEVTIGDSTFTIESGKNPFLNLLVNERKLKVLWKGDWYDLVIKNCQEDSSGKSITYTCTDVYINELSKNGFNLVLDTELENNSGTVLDLAESVLEGTDWNLDRNGSDVIQQKKEEPVYEVNTLEDWTLDDQTAGLQDVTIPASSKVLVFYQQVQDVLKFLEDNALASTVEDIQVAYAQNYERDINSQLVTNAHCYSMSAKWTKTQVEGVDCLEVASEDASEDPYIRIFYNSAVSANYRAERLVKHQVNELDTLTGKYCNVWDVTGTVPSEYSGLISSGDEIYEYKVTEWNDAIIVNNLIVNPKDFTKPEGWLGDSNLTFQLYPPYSSTSHISSYTAKSYLHFLGGKDFYNAGIVQNQSFVPDGFAIGETYIFRYKARENGAAGPGENYISRGITPSVCTYKNSEGTKIIDTNGASYFDITSGPSAVANNWVEFKLTCTKSITRSEFSDAKIGLFLTTKYVEDDEEHNVDCWLEEAQFYREVFGANGDRINPEDIDVDSVASIKYVYYNYTKTRSLLSASDVKPLWSSTTDWNQNFLTPRYNENFEKVRSISAKQSNRFNIIQSLAETFECWAQFIINHDSTGRIVYNEDGTPQKYVRFKNEIGQNTGIGFIYGIDLKAITRTIQSDQIVTKTIVSANNNEFAEKGFCTISRSSENYPRTNFILNFDYFINQGLIDGSALNRDLYDPINGIGYYYLLNQYNTEYDALSEILDAKRLELTKQTSYQTVYDGVITSLQESTANLRNELIRLAGVTTWDAATSYITTNAELDQIRSRMIALKTSEESLDEYIDKKEKLDTSVANLQAVIAQKESEQEALVEDIEALDLEFYKKYSRFIQEGSWSSEDYVDDNLYYLDAQSVAYTSSRPQISYDISVLRISGIEEFKNKVFRLGDIAFIQDPEFFGYVYINGIKTPYKEKVLISEIVSHFDSPDQDSFTVQNYKTQFEDLFQRITSSTQALQYASGAYARAAGIVETTGTINAETLQNSFNVNEQLVFSAKNESVISDSTGLTVSDTTNPNNKTKITSGGLFISTDGGATWKNAVCGEGIATQFLTVGAINTNSISIMDGNFKAFRWDETGINAYYNNGGDLGINQSKFVRFDHYGIYGIDGIDSSRGETFVPIDETDIWENAKFGMTWNGFFVKNKYGDYTTEVSSTDDIRIVSTPQSGSPVELIKIGRIYHDTSDPTNDIFGIRISNNAGDSVMESDNMGGLWLRDHLSISTTHQTTGDQFHVDIGYLTGYKPSEPSIHEVFNANDGFLVYEDGSIKATSGTIGTMSIEKIEYSFYEIVPEREKISKFFADGAEELSYSPENIVFRVYGPDDIDPLSLDDYTVKIELAGFKGVDPEDANFVITEEDNFLITETNESVTTEETEASSNVKIDVLELLYKLEGRFVTETEQGKIVEYKRLKSVLYIEDRNYDVITLKVEDLFGCDVTFEGTQEHPNPNQPKDIEDFKTLLRIISEDNMAEFEITAEIEEDGVTLNKVIPIEFGLTDSMAKFILSAEAISMLVNNTKLVFTEEGLNVYNGGFVIYGKGVDEQGEEIDVPIFYYDPDENQLHVQGSGEFTGKINATEGSFTGNVSADTLTATSGVIGGFIIKQEGLYSIDGADPTEDNGYDVSSSSIKLLGGGGVIEANNINLGVGAHINEYIKLGNNCFIYNPEYNQSSGDFIRIQHNDENAVVLNADGTMKIGQLTFDGQESKIFGNSFSITPDAATFTNVNVTGKISTAVFEKGHIQSVGGMMLFKPSYNIVSWTGTTIILDEEYDGAVGNYVYLINKDGERLPGLISISGIDSNDQKVLTLSTTIVSEKPLTSLIDIGVENDLIIGVNSSNVPDAQGGFLRPRGITISEFTLNQSRTQVDYTTNPKVFLGDLDHSGINFAGTGAAVKETRGFGLYSENVYLTGALTTRINDNSGSTFAGMNTVDGVTATVFGNEDESAIVFWAGANKTTKEEIQKAPFQITAQGSLYASRGTFNGAIITKSSITATSLHGADIYAARIHGTGDPTQGGDGYGLAFFDTSDGIVFFNGDYGSNPQRVFSIDTNGLNKGTDCFIDVSNGIKFSGTDFYTTKNTTSYIHLNGNSIIGEHLNGDRQEVEDSRIYFNSTGINLESEDKKVVLSAPNVQIGNTIYFGNQMMYEQLEQGYNLYVLRKDDQV